VRFEADAQQPIVDHDVNVVQDRLQSAGPHNVGGVDRRQGLAGRGPPSIAGQLTDARAAASSTAAAISCRGT
jgi:hypothetical protein